MQATSTPTANPTRARAASFGVGLLVAVAASGGIAGERLTRAALPVVIAANTVATLAGVFAILVTMRASLVAVPRVARTEGVVSVVLEVAGAIAGIAIVHLVVTREALSAAPWLSERPAQWVNDAVAVFGLLALVRICARRLDARLLVLAVAAVTLYRVTASWWHVDQTAYSSPTSIQQLVVAQLIAAAVALGVFRFAVHRSAV